MKTTIDNGDLHFVLTSTELLDVVNAAADVEHELRQTIKARDVEIAGLRAPTSTVGEPLSFDRVPGGVPWNVVAKGERGAHTIFDCEQEQRARAESIMDERNRCLAILDDFARATAERSSIGKEDAQTFAFFRGRSEALGFLVDRIRAGT